MKRINAAVIITLSMILMGTPGLASEPTVKGSYYIAPYTYRGSPIKDTGFSAGLHTHLISGEHHGFEIAFDYSRIDFKGLNDLRMWDYTALYTHYRELWQIRGGIHFTSANQLFIDGAATLIGGLGYHHYGNWHAALNAYYTYYNDSDPELQILQLTPELGRYLFRGRTSALRLQARGYFIHTENDAVLGLDASDFESLELKLTYQKGNVTLSGFGWVGEQVFARKDRGFTAYNLPEKHDGGYGAAIDYLLDNGMQATLETSVARFEDIGFKNDATMFRATVMLSHPF